MTTVTVQEPQVAAAGAVLRARLEGSHRREAVRTLQHGCHKLGPDARCPSCRGPVVIGATVRVVHGPGCRRRGAIAAAATGVVHPVAEAAGAPHAAVPAAEPTPAEVERPARLEGCERHPHRHRGRHRPYRAPGCDWTSQAPSMAAQEETRRRDQEIGRREEQEICRHGGIRPWVVLRWFVSGCRVAVEGWLATVRGVIRWAGGRLAVWVHFDDGWAPELWALDDLARFACAAA